jgi:hypothetical protein
MLTKEVNYQILSLLLFFYYYVHTLFGAFLRPAPLSHLPHLSSSVSGRSRSALVTDFVEEKT